jgi:hypothetical protein
MQQLINLFSEYPILVILLVGWLLSMVGGAITRAARKAEEQRRKAQRTPRQFDRAPTSTPPELRRPEPSQPSPEDIAAEIRRVMGMEEAPRPTALRETVVTPPPADVPTRAPEAHLEHLGEGVGGLRSQIDSHVGEGVSHRLAPTSGGVGSRVLGTLGGRVQAPREAGPPTRRVKRFDLSDPAAVLVTMEILGKPRALRDFDF